MFTLPLALKKKLTPTLPTVKNLFGTPLIKELAKREPLRLFLSLSLP
jgi:hypothetical protein